jgi:nicotinamide-nucleotide amidase
MMGRMPKPDELVDDAVDLAEQIADLLDGEEVTVACAESLTSGKIAAHLGAAPDSANWFVGGVVSYTDSVKHEVLGVSPGPVVTARAARQMAAGVADLLGADVAVAVTGAGGPQPQDDQPPGTVFMGLYVSDGADVRVEEHHFEGEPPEVLDQTVQHALALLLEGVRESLE